MSRRLCFLLAIGCVILLSGCETYQLIYFVRRYDSASLTRLPKNTKALTYETLAGRQVAFYVMPREDPDRFPDKLWVLFGGNGAMALEWEDIIQGYPDSRTGFLLIDYPGFGACQGHPNRLNILQSSELALVALADHLGVKPERFEGRMCVMGHSLGSATALQFAPGHQVERIILLAPFTNMVDIAEYMVGWPLCQFVPDRFDNMARLAELALQHPRPAVVIIHGARDPIVPVGMGRRLAALYPEWIEYHELPKANHQSFFQDEKALIYRVMQGAAREMRQASRMNGASRTY